METQIIDPLSLPDLGGEYVPLRCRFRRGDEKEFWICNRMHYPRPVLALTMAMEVNDMDMSFTIPQQLFCFPVKAFQSRFRMGWFYQNVVDPTPEEFEVRWPKFQEKLGLYIAHWERLVGEAYNEAKTYCEELKKHDLKELTLYPELTSLLEKAMWYKERMWVLHMEFLYLAYFINAGIFDRTLSEVVPELGEQEKAKLVQGYDTSLYRRVTEMWRLSNLAIDLGLGDLFKRASVDELQSSLEKTDPGRRWLQELRDFLSEWGHMLASHHDLHLPTWAEDPKDCLSLIKSYVDKGKHDPGEETERLAREREEYFQELLKRVKPEQRESFETAVRIFQRVYPYLEDHPRYFEHELVSRVRYIIVEIGRRFVEVGIMDDPNDIFHLTLEELRNSIRDVALALIGRGFVSWDPRSTVSERKEIIKKQREWEPVPIVGTPKPISDPLTIKLWGYGSKEYEAGVRLVGIVDKLTGMAAAPGIAEGPAKVVMGPDEFRSVQMGDILVCPATGPGWVPIFPMVIAIVTNEGGMMSHAAIISREYGLPCVVATGSATWKIETGQRIRVDGNSGEVTIFR